MAEERRPFQKGRPSKAYREGLSWLLRTAFTEDDRMEVIQMLVRQSEGGGLGSDQDSACVHLREAKGISRAFRRSAHQDS